MKKQAANETREPVWTLSQAASELGVERRLVKTWRARFNFLALPTDKFTAGQLRILRALKALLVDHGYALEDVERLFAQAGEAAVISAYGGPPIRRAEPNAARALQDTVRAAAAAGFFGEVYADVEDDDAQQGETPVASYAQARLARLK